MISQVGTIQGLTIFNSVKIKAGRGPLPTELETVEGGAAIFRALFRYTNEWVRKGARGKNISARKERGGRSWILRKRFRPLLVEGKRKCKVYAKGNGKNRR